MNKDYYCVIMAGGVGSRFWPLSRAKFPKQFLDILGVGSTLLQQTFARFTDLVPTENIYIVSNSEYKELIKEQLPELPEENILLEPYRRNTAPCIDYANFRIAQKNPNAKIIVAPSDHLILKEEIFIDCVRTGLKFVGENDALLTLGISPSRPETGYGYIQSMKRKLKSYENQPIRKVKTFTEKPDIAMAKVFYESGDFFWNAGIFFWSLKSIMHSFDQYLPEIHDLFAKGAEHYGTEGEDRFVRSTYEVCPNISIDYGVMEKAENVYVLTADFGWSDLGTWGSLYEHIEKDEKENAISGEHIYMYDSSGNVVNVPPEKLVLLQGLNDYIIVESDHVLLICKKEEEQRIKEFVNDIRSELGDVFI